MNITIKDNFLKDEVLSEFLATITDYNFPWFYQDRMVSYDSPEAREEQTDFPESLDFFFAHIFVAAGKSNSPYSHLLEKLLKPLGDIELIRAKLNATYRHTEPLNTGWHTDNNIEGATTAVLYLNDNNGSTIFKNGVSSPSIANRFVEFDSNIEHTGTLHTDKDVGLRFVLNLNYIKKTS